MKLYEEGIACSLRALEAYISNTYRRIDLCVYTGLPVD